MAVRRRSISAQRVADAEDEDDDIASSSSAAAAAAAAAGAAAATSSAATTGENTFDACPLCHQRLPSRRRYYEEDEDDEGGTNFGSNTFIDQNYFRLLGDWKRSESVDSSRPSSPLPFGGVSSSSPTSPSLDDKYFNQGYYAKFFREETLLGRGLRGSVYLCRHIMYNVLFGQYAVKKVPVGHNPVWLLRMLEEVHTLEQFQHPNVISYKHAWLENHQVSKFGPEVPVLFILMEFASGGTLDAYLCPEEIQETAPTPTRSARRQRMQQQQQQQRRYLSEDRIWSMFVDVVRGIHHLHEHGLLHRDLKPNNLLLRLSEQSNESPPCVMISDFGESALLSRQGDQSLRSGNTGTLEYMAPELLQTTGGEYTSLHTKASDVWSLGLVLFYLCFSALPFRENMDVDRLRDEILQTRVLPFDPMSSPVVAERIVPISPALAALLRLILVPDPAMRPPTDMILAICLSHDVAIAPAVQALSPRGQRASVGAEGTSTGGQPVQLRLDRLLRSSSVRPPASITSMSTANLVETIALPRAKERRRRIRLARDYLDLAVSVVAAHALGALAISIVAVAETFVRASKINVHPSILIASSVVRIALAIAHVTDLHGDLLGVSLCALLVLLCVTRLYQ